MSVQKAKGGRKNRKWDRNKLYCAYYRSHNIREKNKLRRIRKHLVRFPNDGCAINVLDRLLKIVKG